MFWSLYFYTLVNGAKSDVESSIDVIRLIRLLILICKLHQKAHSIFFDYFSLYQEHTIAVLG